MRHSESVLVAASVVAVVLCSNDLVLAQRLEEPIQEFFIAKTSYPQEEGEIQVTLRPAFLHSEELDEREFGWKIEYGVSDRLELELEMGYLSRKLELEPNAGGLENIEIGMLYNFLTVGHSLALSVTSEVELPSGTESIGAGEAEWENLFILAKTFGSAQLHLNAGVALSEEESEFLYNVAGVFPIDRSFSLTAELNGVEVLEGIEPFFTPGIYFRPLQEDPLFEFGVGFPVGLEGRSTPWGVVAKVTLEF